MRSCDNGLFCDGARELRRRRSTVSPASRPTTVGWRRPAPIDTCDEDDRLHRQRTRRSTRRCATTALFCNGAGDLRHRALGCQAGIAAVRLRRRRRLHRRTAATRPATPCLNIPPPTRSATTVAFCNGARRSATRSLDCTGRHRRPTIDDGVSLHRRLLRRGRRRRSSTHAVDALCDDGAFCNGAETCDQASSTARRAQPPSTDDGVPLHRRLLRRGRGRRW